MSTLEEQLGRRVASLRRAAGLSQAKLGELIGVQPEHISRIETGARGASFTTLVRLADALGVELHELVRLSPADTPRDRALARLVWFASRLSDTEIELVLTVGAAVLDAVRPRQPRLVQRSE